MLTHLAQGTQAELGGAPSRGWAGAWALKAGLSPSTLHSGLLQLYQLPRFGFLSPSGRALLPAQARASGPLPSGCRSGAQPLSEGREPRAHLSTGGGAEE